MFHPLYMIRFLRIHRAEWTNYGVDPYTAASLKATPLAVPCVRIGWFLSNQVFLPLAQALKHVEVKRISRAFPILVICFQSSEIISFRFHGTT
ncbi:unnamed protein product [Brassica rapa subsp. trilocularis]